MSEFFVWSVIVKYIYSSIKNDEDEEYDDFGDSEEDEEDYDEEEYEPFTKSNFYDPRESRTVS